MQQLINNMQTLGHIRHQSAKKSGSIARLKSVTILMHIEKAQNFTAMQPWPMKIMSHKTCQSLLSLAMAHQNQVKRKQCSSSSQVSKESPMTTRCRGFPMASRSRKCCTTRSCRTTRTTVLPEIVANASKTSQLPT